jgi:predicted exporter
MPGEWWLRIFLVLLALYLGLMAGMVWGAPLDEALAIVRRTPAMEAGQAVLREQTGQRTGRQAYRSAGSSRPVSMRPA